MKDRYVSPNASGEWLKAARISHGESVAEAAEAAGVSVRTIGRWEREGVNGRTSAVRILALCNHYDTSADTLIKLIMQPA